jgi:trehalose/maltose hydrolase-like predicted phosphorylase
LAYPLSIVSQPAAIAKDLAYYEERMAPEGPAMSWSVLATLYARLAQPDKAHALFQRSYLPNRLPPFGVLAETAGGTNPYFVTGAGGTLQTLLFGFAGLSIGADGIRHQPGRLPAGWTRLHVQLPARSFTTPARSP